LKNACLVIIFVVASSLPAMAITGLGFGVHAGLTAGYDYTTLDDAVKEISDSLEARGFPAIESPDFNEQLTVLGAHVKVGTLPILDFIGFVDYSWKEKDIASNISLRVSDVTLGATALKKFGQGMLKPYVGAGVAAHKLVYSIEIQVQDTVLAAILPEDETKVGYHVLVGAEIGLGLLPIAPYLEGRYNFISTPDKTTKYLVVLVGATFNL